jgi:hypothetical protein
MRLISDTNLLSGLSVVGRVGSNAYQVNPNTLTRTSEAPETSPNNPIAVVGEGAASFVNQILNMGLGDIKAKSILWQGKEFRAVRKDGSPMYGLLGISNGLPASLNISRKKGAPPYLAIGYVYPDPPGSLGGFPKRTIISSLFKDGLHPWMQITLLELQKSEHPLPAEVFAEGRFVTADVVFTNIYRNNALYSLGADGQMTEIRGPGTGATNAPLSASRRVLDFLRRWALRKQP